MKKLMEGESGLAVMIMLAEMEEEEKEEEELIH